MNGSSHGSVQPPAESTQSCALFLIAQSAVGFGLGVLASEKLNRSQRQTTSIIAFGIGAAAALPVIVQAFASRINSPNSARAMRRRLRSIREGEGFDDNEHQAF